MKERVYVERRPWSDSVDLALMYIDFDGKRSVAQVSKVEIKQDFEHIAPTLSMQVETAQALMDELWRCGLRPTEGTGSAGSLAATERHLADMRAIAFDLMEKRVERIKAAKQIMKGKS